MARDPDRPFPRPDAPWAHTRIRGEVPAVRAKFLELDALLQELTDATMDAQTVRVSFSFLVDGLITAGPLIKVYERRERPPLTQADLDGEAPPITLAGTAARMEQLRGLAAAGHLRPEELQLLADFYLEESDA